MFKYSCGDKVQDSITSFTGIVTARTEHLDGAIAYELTSLELNDGLPQKCWFDECRLSVKKENAVGFRGSY